MTTDVALRFAVDCILCNAWRLPTGLVVVDGAAIHSGAESEIGGAWGVMIFLGGGGGGHDLQGGVIGRGWVGPRGMVGGDVDRGGGGRFPASCQRDVTCVSGAQSAMLRFPLLYYTLMSPKMRALMETFIRLPRRLHRAWLWRATSPRPSFA